jgi:mediator of RNA polymerase II transcription subunit 12
MLFETFTQGKGSRLTGTSSNINSSNRLGVGSSSMTNEVSISHILGTSWSGDLDLDMGSSNFGVGGGRSNFAGTSENVPLASYARYVLRQICSQPWVHQRCLQNPEELLKLDGLLDSCLSLRQAQRLLQMISRPDSGASVAEDISNEHQDYRQVIFHISKYHIM